ncbi:MAG: pseudouridine-5'-phosphate glycosidase [Acidobacteriota bacterium]|nr:pseudouridine-5'-phosphate glycosidase [Acidobacteriota bacterium]
MVDQELFRYSPEVQSALAANKPVVALESTVIAHGLPRPQNLETAFHLEQIVKEAEAIPATIAILNGKLCVGLKEEQISFIAGDTHIKKISIRDLPIAIAQRWNGATTVASTSWIAHRAGIKVFATGGIGGVHRGPLPDLSGADVSGPDVSADLPALASTPIVVVCSGAKIVLDLTATREWLETYGITVVGYQCDEMPAFYSRRSGLPVDVRVDSSGDVVKLFLAQQSLGIKRALLVTVPVPREFEIPGAELKTALDSALKEAQSEQVAGRQLTPFLLSRMAHASQGATLTTNIALLENNVRLAAEIAGSFLT